MAFLLNTELQVVRAVHVLPSVDIADQLQPSADMMIAISFPRLHGGVPFCCTRVHLPMDGSRLIQLPEIAALAEPGPVTASR
jgi:hypothetical protein